MMNGAADERMLRGGIVYGLWGWSAVHAHDNEGCGQSSYAQSSSTDRRRRRSGRRSALRAPLEQGGKVNHGIMIADWGRGAEQSRAEQGRAGQSNG